MFFSKDPTTTARQPTRPRENSDSIEDGLNFNFDKVASGGRVGRPSKGVRVIPLEEVNQVLDDQSKHPYSVLLTKKGCTCR